MSDLRSKIIRKMQSGGSVGITHRSVFKMPTGQIMYTPHLMPGPAPLNGAGTKATGSSKTPKEDKANMYTSFHDRGRRIKNESDAEIKAILNDPNIDTDDESEEAQLLVASIINARETALRKNTELGEQTKEAFDEYNTHGNIQANSSEPVMQFDPGSGITQILVQDREWEVGSGMPKYIFANAAEMEIPENKDRYAIITAGHLRNTLKHDEEFANFMSVPGREFDPGALVANIISFETMNDQIDDLLDRQEYQTLTPGTLTINGQTFTSGDISLEKYTGSDAKLNPIAESILKNVSPQLRSRMLAHGAINGEGKSANQFINEYVTKRAKIEIEKPDKVEGTGDDSEAYVFPTLFVPEAFPEISQGIHSYAPIDEDIGLSLKQSHDNTTTGDPVPRNNFRGSVQLNERSGNRILDARDFYDSEDKMAPYSRSVPWNRSPNMGRMVGDAHNSLRLLSTGQTLEEMFEAIYPSSSKQEISTMIDRVQLVFDRDPYYLAGIGHDNKPNTSLERAISFVDTLMNPNLVGKDGEGNDVWADGLTIEWTKEENYPTMSKEDPAFIVLNQPPAIEDVIDDKNLNSQAVATELGLEFGSSDFLEEIDRMAEEFLFTETYAINLPNRQKQFIDDKWQSEVVKGTAIEDYILRTARESLGENEEEQEIEAKRQANEIKNQVFGYSGETASKTQSVGTTIDIPIIKGAGTKWIGGGEFDALMDILDMSGGTFVSSSSTDWDQEDDNRFPGDKGNYEGYIRLPVMSNMTFGQAALSIMLTKKNDLNEAMLDPELVKAYNKWAEKLGKQYSTPLGVDTYDFYRESGKKKLAAYLKQVQQQ